MVIATKVVIDEGKPASTQVLREAEVTLKFSEYEALALYIICVRVGGNPHTTLRGVFSSLPTSFAEQIRTALKYQVGKLHNLNVGNEFFVKNYQTTYFSDESAAHLKSLIRGE